MIRSSLLVSLSLSWMACQEESPPLLPSSNLLCEVGQTRACYVGPAGTEGVGACHAGTQTCAAGGLAWSGCQGQMMPQPESCASPADEDCDGQADGNPPCVWNAVGSTA